MAQMIRKQIYIRKRQQALLKRLASARQVSEAEIIRQAIDQQAKGLSRLVPADPGAWDEALAFMRSLAAQGQLPDRPRAWTREDLYSERLSRHGRHPR